MTITQKDIDLEIALMMEQPVFKPSYEFQLEYHLQYLNQLLDKKEDPFILHEVISNLHLHSCSEDQRINHDYWFLIRRQAMSYTAFHTINELQFFLNSTGLKIDKMPVLKTRSSHVITGSYIEKCHRTRLTMPLKYDLCIPHLSNGDYTKGYIVLGENESEPYTIHYLNPNVPRRYIFSHSEANKIINMLGAKSLV